MTLKEFLACPTCGYLCCLYVPGDESTRTTHLNNQDHTCPDCTDGRRTVPCETCGGTGLDPVQSPLERDVLCATCSGSGSRPMTEEDVWDAVGRALRITDKLHDLNCELVESASGVLQAAIGKAPKEAAMARWIDVLDRGKALLLESDAALSDPIIALLEEQK